MIREVSKFTRSSSRFDLTIQLQAGKLRKTILNSNFLGVKQATNTGHGTDEDNYTVLLILTDGVITDLQ